MSTRSVLLGGTEMTVSDALWIFVFLKIWQEEGGKKNQPSVRQTGGESEGAKSYGVCLFLVPGSREILLSARQEWAHAEAGILEMIHLCDVFKPVISELNMPEINPGFNLNSSSDESSKRAKAGCALIYESGARPTSNRRVSSKMWCLMCKIKIGDNKINSYKTSRGVLTTTGAAPNSKLLL